MKPMMVCCAAALTLGLAACGGGDGGGGGRSVGSADSGPAVEKKPFSLDPAAVNAAIAPGTLPLSNAPQFSVRGDELFPVNSPHEFVKSETASAEIAGWKGSIYERSLEGDDGTVVKTTIISYTDIDDPGDATYLEYFSESDAPERLGVTSATPEGVLTLDVDEVTLKIAEAFRVDLAGLDEGKNSLRGTVSRQGSHIGIPGTFDCTGTCSITLNEALSVTATEGTWTFTPTADVADIVLEGVVPDSDYLNLAAWLTSTESPEGRVTHEAGTFARGADTTNYGRVSAVEGSANYTGPATGFYVRETAGPGSGTTPVAAGQFVADARLTAHFGGSAVPGAMRNRISGTVNGFRDSAGRTINEDWSLELGGDIAGETARINAQVGSFGGQTRGSGGEGGWEGGFRGDHAGSAPPGTAAGSFQGHFLDGDVLGVFAAHLSRSNGGS